MPRKNAPQATKPQTATATDVNALPVTEQREVSVLPKAERSPRALKIRHIVLHCTAGFASAKAVQEWFKRPKKKGGRGWSVGGYHVIIDRNGDINRFYDYGRNTNGVKGFNSETIHIAYVGGVFKTKDGTLISKDTRNKRQKDAIIEVLNEVMDWLVANGKDITKDLQVVGHRDFSNDKNKDNVIQPWERLKDCPSFDAIPEYELWSSDDRLGGLPTKK